MPIDPKSVTPDRDADNNPLWRQHFPIDTEQEASRSRREFLGGLTVAGGTMACGQASLHTLNEKQDSPERSTSIGEVHPRLELEKKFDNLTVGEAILFHYPDHKSPCLLLKLNSEDFVAFTQKCTHLACPVIPELDRGEFHCPCHHGSFDIQTGEPLSGPPREPLQTVDVERAADGTLTAVGIRA